jgi:LuxR family transcriptional regulator, quorum-sensing system regulator BjaR1
MSNAISKSATDIVQALERAPSILKVKEVFRRAVEQYGYEFFACTAPPRADEGVLDPLLFEEWPQEWLNRYVAKDYVSRDPMVRSLFMTIHPYSWTEALRRKAYPKADQAIVFEAAEWGMVEGFVVPIYGVGGQVHAVTMAGRKVRVDPEARAELHLFSIYAYARAKQLKRSSEPFVRLTRRQTQSLQWAALGKTDWEVAQQLCISESTAHKHIESAKQRFGVSTRMQAVVAALRQGSIQI